MKNHLISGGLFILIVLTACRNKEKGNHYEIGSNDWYVELPKNYVSFANMPDTLQRDLICEPGTKAETIMLLKLQKGDTLWTEPVPNSLCVFLVPKNNMNKKRQDCLEQLIKSYSASNESGTRMEYRHKENEVSIGEVDFLELENTFLDSMGKFSHGDLHYIGVLDDYAIQIQLSYKDIGERVKLQNLILKSKFK